MTEPSIIYADSRFVAIEKPAGWIVHAVRLEDKAESAKKNTKSIVASRLSPYAAGTPVLTDWLLSHYPELSTVGDDPRLRPGIVHRLDRDVSGVMVIARTQTYFEYLKKLFQTHEIKKYYFAIVVGSVKEKHGFIDAPIGRRSGSVKQSVFSKNRVREALTEYRVIKKIGDDATLLEIQTHTGRTHQIRVHLASIGHPIVGDELYGKRGAKILHAVRLYLHAFRIEFPIEEGNKMRFETEMPESFEEFISLAK